MSKQILTDIEVVEVSLVDRGAIGEVFTLIKSEDSILDENVEKRIVQQEGEYFVFSEDGSKKLGGPYKTKEEALMRLKEVEHFKNVNKLSNEEIASVLEKMDNNEFINIMNQMMLRYKELNKSEGGTNMDELKTMFEEFMNTVNTNFSQVNKAVDELQEVTKKLQEETVTKSQLDEMNAVKNTETVAKMDETTNVIKSFVDNITSKMDELAKGLGTVTDLVTKFESLNSSVEELKEKVTKIESMENNSNALVSDVAKSETKTVFWKSILGSQE